MKLIKPILAKIINPLYPDEIVTEQPKLFFNNVISTILSVFLTAGVQKTRNCQRRTPKLFYWPCYRLFRFRSSQIYRSYFWHRRIATTSNSLA